MATIIDIEKIKPIHFPSTKMDGLDVVRYLKTLPTVDAVEVVHARWILFDIENWKGVCSNCHRQDSVDPLATHCRFCGAKMDVCAKK